ncbi:hypothetical protein NL676_034305 [Syzygium grande]|nr:hypothetical protein NL676_034305 [Syzygium grande]
MFRQNDEEGTPPWLRAGSGRPAKIRSVLSACLLSPPHFVTASLNSFPFFSFCKTQNNHLRRSWVTVGGVGVGGGGDGDGEHEKMEKPIRSGRIEKQLLWVGHGRCFSSFSLCFVERLFRTTGWKRARRGTHAPPAVVGRRNHRPRHRPERRQPPPVHPKVASPGGKASFLSSK